MREIIYVLFLPLLFANIIHMFLVKADLLKWMKIPIHKKLFGENKTFRGFVVLITLTGILSAIGTYFIDNYAPLLGFKYGCLLGFAYVFFELPNSYFKRRLGIAPGTSPTRNRLLFNLLDKTDSTFGVCFSYTLVTDLSWIHCGLLLLISASTHVLISILLVKLKVKKSF